MSSVSVIDRLRSYDALLRQYGWRRCIFRAAHDWQRRHGWLKRRWPAWRWEDRPLASWVKPRVPSAPAEFRAYRAQSQAHFFFPPGQPPQPRVEWSEAAQAQAEMLLEGKFRYFSFQDGELGYPDPDWLLNPFTGQRDHGAAHWTACSDFEPARGDIKYIWEPSRFGWAYSLARAYAHKREDRFAEAFWRLLESWLAANPPQSGPNWSCGQEVAIRVLACTFAGHVFWASPATTDERWARLTVLLAASAERIAAHIDAARNQMGNHATSEAAGLLTVGLLFPELRDAARWRAMARYVLEDEARRYNAPDGSYTQHSMNYQRLMLHAYLWSLALERRNGHEFSEVTRQRLACSSEFLYQMQDPQTGRLPNYGPNDGALMLPLSDCDYLDYRPVISAMHYLMHGERCYPAGPWDEDLLWLFGPAALGAPSRVEPRAGRDFRTGGYFTLHGENSWAMVRCHSYRNRPNQADMLHVDLWWRGLNLLRDSGTYTYYDPAQHWNRYFVSAAAHNTVTVGGADQMLKGPRFQWKSLLQSRHLGRRRLEHVEIWEGEHYGYRRLAARATHRRTLCCFDQDCWVIIDDILGTGVVAAALRWHLPDVAYALADDALHVQTELGSVSLQILMSGGGALRVLRAADEPTGRGGWCSLYYGVREPALTLCAETCARLPLRFLTLLTPGPPATINSADLLTCFSWCVEDGLQTRIHLCPPRAASSPIRLIEWDGKPCASRS
jgi:hypothetical protein